MDQVGAERRNSKTVALLREECLRGQNCLQIFQDTKADFILSNNLHDCRKNPIIDIDLIFVIYFLLNLNAPSRLKSLEMRGTKTNET